MILVKIYVILLNSLFYKYRLFTKISIAKHALGIAKGYYKRELSASISNTLQLSIYRKLLKLPIFFYKRTKSGEITSRLFQDVSQAETILTSK